MAVRLSRSCLSVLVCFFLPPLTPPTCPYKLDVKMQLSRLRLHRMDKLRQSLTFGLPFESVVPAERPFLNSLSSSRATFYTTSTEQKQKREASSSNFLVGNVSLSPSAGSAFQIRARCALYSFACVDIRINVCDIIMYFGFICSRRAGYHLLCLFVFLVFVFFVTQVA